jgi:hypothetical protein
VSKKLFRETKEKRRRKDQEGERWKYSRKGVLELIVKSSGKDSFSEGEERSQTIRYGEVVRREIVKYFSTSEVRQVENLTKFELQSPKLKFNPDC